MTTLEILKAARELISVPERWTQGAYARDNQGAPCATTSDEATCFCVRGAVRRVSYSPFVNINFAARIAAYKALEEAGEDGRLACWQDAPERTHAEVLARFDTAIARLEARP